MGEPGGVNSSGGNANKGWKSIGAPSVFTRAIAKMEMTIDTLSTAARIVDSCAFERKMLRAVPT